jgi:biotin/methionine sulfoxide reductase
MTHARKSLTHWGGFSAGIESGDIGSVTPLDGDR